MKVSANQASSNNALPSLDAIKSKGLDGKGDLEEKFLDLLSELFQGSNLQSQLASLNQQLPNVKLAEVPAPREDSDDLLEKRPIPELPKECPEQKTDKPVLSENTAKAEQLENKVVQKDPSDHSEVETASDEAAPQPEGTDIQVAQKCGNEKSAPAEAPPVLQSAQANVSVVEESVETAPNPVENSPAKVAAPAAPEAAPAVAPDGMEMDEVVKKILAEIRKSLMPKGAPEEDPAVRELPVERQQLQPLDLLKQLFESSNSNANANNANGQQNADLANLVARLSKIDPQLGGAQDLLKRLSALSGKGSMDVTIGALSNGTDKVLSRPAKQSPLMELASKRSSEIVDKVKEAIEKAAKSRDGSTLTLNLNPKDLGEVVVRVTQREDQIFAKISPKAVEVQEIIKAKIDEVVKVLTSAGFKASNVHISVGGGFEFADNGSHFAQYSGEGEQSSSSNGSKWGQKQENLQGGAFSSENKTSNSNELAGWVA